MFPKIQQTNQNMREMKVFVQNTPLQLVPRPNLLWVTSLVNDMNIIVKIGLVDDNNLYVIKKEVKMF